MTAPRQATDPRAAEALGRTLAARRRGRVPQAAAAPEAGPAPPSFAQEGIWLAERAASTGALFNVGFCARVRGPVDAAQLARAVERLVDRHESLRTTFAERDGTPVPLVGAGTRPRLESEQASDEAEALRRATEVLRRPLDLTRGPLARACLYTVAPDRHLLLLGAHHSVCDGWSLGVILGELAALYAGEVELPSAPSFAPVAREQRRRYAAEHPALDYWRERLAGLPALELPADRPRTSRRTLRAEALEVALEPELVARLRELGRTEGASLFMTLLAALEVVLFRQTGQSDVAVGAPVANRSPEQRLAVGPFVNLLVLRTDLGGDPTFRELLRRVRGTAAGALRHQDVPFERVLREVGREMPVEVALAYQSMPAPALALGEATLEPVELDTGASRYELELQLWERDGGLSGTLRYAADLFERATAARLLDRLRRVLDAVASAPETRLSELPLLTTAEQASLKRIAAGERVELPPRCLSQLIEEQVERTPDAPAVAFGREELSYRELNERANRLAHRLRALGVGPEERVGVFCERSPELVVALLAVLKSGGAYVPVDPAYPEERIRFMLEDAQPRVVVTTAALSARMSAPRTLLVEEPLAEPDSNPQPLAGPEHLAYVLYTSGSTGRPKGAMVTQRGLVNYVLWAARAYELEEGRGSPLHSSIAFDLTVTSLYPALVRGRTVRLVPEEEAGVESLVAALRRGRYSLLKITPAHAELLAESLLPEELGRATRRLVVGGEALFGETLQRWARHGPETRVVNEYGPTETVVGCCVYELAAGEARPGPVPIGGPIANTRLYVLDAALRPVPQGARGELFIGGAGVARGYLGRPSLTAERFLPDPFADEPGARMYRSGDLVRYLPEGSLEYLGRADFQLKIRGYRIEPGEIEAALLRHPQVEQAVVQACGEGEQRRLAAYLVGAEAPERELRSFLRDLLPEYMVPAGFVWLDRLPLTANGKVDREALPDAGVGEAGYVAPRDERDRAVASAFAEVLGRERVGVFDDFFTLGAHSLLASRAAARLRDALGVEVPLRLIFEHRTAAALAEALPAGQVEQGPALLPLERPAEGVASLPSSFGQERLWFLGELDAEAARAYAIAGAVRVEGELDLPALEEALNLVVARHEPLRTAIRVVDDELRQLVQPELHLGLPVVDVPERELGRRLREEARRPFDLGRAPLVRATVFRLGEQRHVLFLALHHVVADGWSLGVLALELGQAYAALRRGERPQLPELAVQYGDFAAWQRERLEGPELERQLRYWREQLADLEPLELPVDRPRPAVQSFRGRRARLHLPVDLVRRLEQLGQSEQATLYMVLLAGFGALLSLLSGQERVAIGSPVAGRPRPELEDLIGFFVNTLVLEADAAGEPSFRSLLTRVRETALAAYANQDVPFEKLVEELRPERDLSRSPLFQVMLVLQNTPPPALTLEGATVRPLDVDLGTTHFDLVLDLEPGGDGLSGHLWYNADLFEARTAERLVERLARLLEAVAAQPDTPLGALDVLPARRAARTRRPEPAAPAEVGYTPPRTEVEALVASAFAEVLQLERVGAGDDFFERGGHSLLAIRAASRLREALGSEVPLRLLFQHRTVAALAEALPPAGEERAPALVRLRRPQRGPARLPSSFGQERLWFLAELDSEAARAYNVAGAVRADGKLDLGLLEQATNVLVARHEALRTALVVEEGKLWQLVEPELHVPLPLVDLSGREQELEQHLADEARRPFELARAPLLRVRAFRLAEERHVLSLAMHHVVSDDWSLGVLLRELAEAYAALRDGEEPRLPELEVQYGDFAAWQREQLVGPALDEQLEYWRGQLADLEPLELPTDRPRPPLQSFHGRRARLELPAPLVRRLEALGRAEGATLFMVLLAAFGALLGRMSGQEELAIGSPIANRRRAQLERLVGFFVNTLVLRTDLSGDPSFRSLLTRVRETAVEAYANQDVPFEKLVDELQPQRDLSRTPLFQAMLVLQDTPPATLELDEATLEPLEIDPRTAHFDLTLGFERAGDGLTGHLWYNADLFEPVTAERSLRRLALLLEAAVDDPDGPLSRTGLLLPEEREQLERVNQTELELPDRCLHELFEAQAERTPAATALELGGERIAYRELNERANRLAHRLRRLGVRPEERVGIFLSRSPELVAALFAVLKAGGAYVPLDPSYPERRLAFMVEDARARVVLSERELADRLPGAAATLVLVDEPLDEPAANPEPLARPENLAYVLYTSGSTGRPKGVEIEHRSAVALREWAARTFEPEEVARVLGATSVSFDLSVFELFVTLGLGGTVVLAAENALDLIAFDGLEPTLLNTVPSAMAELVRARRVPASVRTVTLAGERLPEPLARAILETTSVTRLHNMWGPTEDTTYSTGIDVPPDFEGRPLIGTPFPGTRIHVLDRRLERVPIGVVGEAYLGGAGLARGYLDRPALTAERFLPDPYGPPGSRMYRTGDLVRFTLAGELDFVARADFQLKIRGYRVEPGEIEAALLDHPEVEQAAVQARGEGEQRRLVAYVVGAGSHPAEDELAEHLRARLPEYMLPATYVWLDELPVMPNGKIDRKALPDPEPAAARPRPAFVAPRTPLEEQLAAVFAEVLEIDPIGIDDDFFELGGNSILVARAAARLREEIQVELPLRLLFERRTVAALAADLPALGALAPAAPPIPRLERKARQLAATTTGGDDGASASR
ncbi:MAG TPA: amino acid adenylation domain-containing protein [Gaiellaceae bacterium]